MPPSSGIASSDAPSVRRPQAFARGRTVARDGAHGPAKLDHRAARRRRAIHGTARRHGDRDGAAADGADVRCRAGRPQHRHLGLHAHRRGVHSRERLGHRPVRGARGVRLGDRNIHGRVDRMCDERHARHVYRRAHPAGRRRRDDGPGRPPHRAAQHRKAGPDPRHRVSHLASAHRAGDRAAARRADHNLRQLAVDILPQYSDRACRARACARAHSERARRRHWAVRLAGLRGHRARELRADV